MTAIGAALLLTLTACSTPAKPATRIDPATATLSDSFKERLPAQTNTTKITVTPATQPTANTQPVDISIGGRIVKAPAGTAVTVELSEAQTPGETIHDQAAYAAGATLRTDGDKGDFSGSAPEVKLTGGTNVGIGGGGSKSGKAAASGGGTDAAWQAVTNYISGKSGAVKAFWAIGIGLWLVALIYWIVQRVIGGKTDVYMIVVGIGAGFGFMTMGFLWESAPWMLVLLAVGIVGGIAWWIYRYEQAEHAAKPSFPAPGTDAQPPSVAPGAGSISLTTVPTMSRPTGTI